jgi:outer membrane protein assembly factor BamB
LSFRSWWKRLCFGAPALLLALALAQDNQQAPSPPGWTTWGGGADRVGWAKNEKALSRDTASKLALKWRAQLDIKPKFEILSASTAPVIAEDVGTPRGRKDLVFVVAYDDTIYALAADNGDVVWKKRFANPLKPKSEATYLCPNTQNATPVVDPQSGTLYVLTSDGKLRSLSTSTGEELIPAVDFTPPYARTWSLNLVDGVMYVPVTRGCNGAISHFVAMDLGDKQHPLSTFYTSLGRPAGAWGRGGMVLGPKGLYAQTADGAYDPAGGKFGGSLVVLGPRDLRLVDSFTPSNVQALNSKDLDLGSASPIVFPFNKWKLVATSSKEATIFLLDANVVGGNDHHTPLYQAKWGNDEMRLWGRGVWGSMASWEDGAGQRWLAVPMWGPPSKDAPKFQNSYGDIQEGTVMVFRLAVENDKPTLVPVWMSRDMHVPDVPVIANGVLLVVSTGENTRQGGYFPAEVRAKPHSHATLYAFDAENGKELYSSADAIPSWVHFNGLAVSKGRVYFGTWDGSIYSFGVE